MRVIGIDPGNTESAYCIIDGDTLRPIDFGKMENDVLRRYLRQNATFEEEDRAAIEMVASYGMAVGRDVFDTCRWVGRFEEILTRKLYVPPRLIYRKEEKLHICHDSRYALLSYCSSDIVRNNSSTMLHAQMLRFPGLFLYGLPVFPPVIIHDL